MLAERIPLREGGEHGLSLADQSTAQARDQIDPDARKWMSPAKAWPEKRFALDLPEKTAWQ